MSKIHYKLKNVQEVEKDIREQLRTFTKQTHNEYVAEFLTTTELEEKITSATKTIVDGGEMKAVSHVYGWENSTSSVLVFSDLNLESNDCNNKSYVVFKLSIVINENCDIYKYSYNYHVYVEEC